MNWTRRHFLNAGIAGSVAVGSSGAGELIPTIQPLPNAVTDWPAAERAFWIAAMDTIIPRGDSMPSASEAGGIEYFVGLQKSSSDIAKDFANFTELLGRLTQTTGKAFPQLRPDERVATLKLAEQQEPMLFGKFRDYVYESYYTQPQVWKLIGYQLYPTDHAGPHMKPFDDAILEQVRAKPRFYRDDA
jgi:Gluconate 2-dehydrogenase subunit 3